MPTHMIVRGIVVRGKGEGRKLGYPTANLSYLEGSPRDGAAAPEPGVWLARTLVGFEIRAALAVVGMWKTEGDLPSVEVFLLDFKKEIYEAPLTVSLIKKLRELEKFPDTQALVRQIEKDVEEARRYFMM